MFKKKSKEIKESICTEQDYEDFEYARSIINNEGIGYALLSYCSGDVFKNKELTYRWNKIAKELKEFEDFINKTCTYEEF